MKENINLLLERLTDEQYQKDILIKFENDPDYFDYSEISEFCKFEGKIESKKLIQILNISKKNKKLRKLLPQLLYYSNAETITDEVFNLILKYPKKIRNNLLIALAHCNISFYQLHYINSLNICSEAFFQLLSIYCENSSFTLEDLKKFLKDNVKKNNKLLIKSFLEYNLKISSDKIKIIELFL